MIDDEPAELIWDELERQLTTQKGRTATGLEIIRAIRREPGGVEAFDSTSAHGVWTCAAIEKRVLGSLPREEVDAFRRSSRIQFILRPHLPS
jgi:hypothetical protein